MEVKIAVCPFCGLKIHEEDSRELPRKRDEHLKICPNLKSAISEMKECYKNFVKDYPRISEEERNNLINSMLRGYFDGRLHSFIGGMRCQECGRYIEIPRVGRHEVALSCLRMWSCL